MNYNHLTGLYNSRNPLVRYVFNRRLMNVYLALPKLFPDIRILDIGCGNGEMLEVLSKKYTNLYGVDPNPEQVKQASKIPNVKVSLGFAEALPYGDKYFDVVICMDVIEHIKDYKAAISEMKRVLKNNGKVILTFPNETNWTLARFLLGRRPVKEPTHLNRFSPQKMKKLFGLRVEEITNIPNINFNLALSCMIKMRDDLK